MSCPRGVRHRVTCNCSTFLAKRSEFRRCWPVYYPVTCRLPGRHVNLRERQTPLSGCLAKAILDFLHQAGNREGLLQEIHTLFENALINNDVIGITGYEEYADAGL